LNATPAFAAERRDRWADSGSLMEPDFKTLAETKRQLLLAGLDTLGQLAAWADDRISELAQPPYWLIAVSTALSEKDAADALGEVDGVADAATVWRDVARGLLEALDREPARDSEIGRYLFYLGMNNEAPTLGTMGELMSFWDSIDLARDGVYGDLSEERQRLRRFLAVRAAEGGVQQAVAPDGAAPRR
jgi:hypothetical protein